MSCAPEMSLTQWSDESYKLTGMSRIPIDTIYFSGFMYVLIQGLKDAPANYFSKYKRCFQYVIQGKFKTEIPFSNLYTGQVWSESLSKSPPSWLQSLFMPVLRNIQPGVQISLSGDKPYIISPLMSAMQTIHMNLPGNEPNLPNSIELLENDDLSAMGVERA